MKINLFNLKDEEFSVYVNGEKKIVDKNRTEFEAFEGDEIVIEETRAYLCKSRMKILLYALLTFVTAIFHALFVSGKALLSRSSPYLIKRVYKVKQDRTSTCIYFTKSRYFETSGDFSKPELESPDDLLPIRTEFSIDENGMNELIKEYKTEILSKFAFLLILPAFIMLMIAIPVKSGALGFWTIIMEVSFFILLFVRMRRFSKEVAFFRKTVERDL